MKLKISKENKNTFLVENPALSGSPYVGRGRTMVEAIGNYFIVYQKEFGVEFELTDEVQKTENNRRRSELAKR